MRVRLNILCMGITLLAADSLTEAHPWLRTSDYARRAPAVL